MSLVSLVYVSFASDDMTEDHLQEILVKARDKNRRLNVTGMLLYRDRFFIQALEGEQEVVEPLFKMIAADPRHKNVILVYTSEITERTFSDWAMGFNPIDEQTAREIPGFINFLDKPGDGTFFNVQPNRATTLLNSFKNRVYF